MILALASLLVIISAAWPWVFLHGTAMWIVGIVWAVVVELPALALLLILLIVNALERHAEEQESRPNRAKRARIHRIRSRRTG